MCLLWLFLSNWRFQTVKISGGGSWSDRGLGNKEGSGYGGVSRTGGVWGGEAASDDLEQGHQILSISFPSKRSQIRWMGCRILTFTLLLCSWWSRFKEFSSPLVVGAWKPTLLRRRRERVNYVALCLALWEKGLWFVVCLIVAPSLVFSRMILVFWKIN